MSHGELGVGIDLGTSNSSICRLDVGRGTYDFDFAKDEGGRTDLPSLVSVYGGEMYFGDAAVRRERSADASSLRNFKLLLRDNTPVQLGDREYEPVELMHRFLRYLKGVYEAQWGPLSKAVITVPAYEEFDLDYQERLRQAAAGADGKPLFTDVKTLKEPDAVLVSLIDVDQLEGQTILVFDMGGGTLDVSVRKVTPNPGEPKRPILKQLAITGSSAAGVALTFDYGVKLVEQWATKSKITLDIGQIEQVIKSNFAAFDASKIALSGLSQREGLDSTIVDPFTLEGGEFGRAIQLSPRPVDLTELSSQVCDDAVATVEKALSEAGLLVTDIDTYIMVGGASQLPLMRHRLVEFFGKQPLSNVSDLGRIDPRNAISKGAAVFDLERPSVTGDSSAVNAPSVPNTSPILEQILPYDLSLLVDAGAKLQVLVSKGTNLPAPDKSVTFYMPKADDNIDIALYRGSGMPSQAHEVTRRRVWFDRKLAVNAEVHVTFEVADDGAVTVFVSGDSGEPKLAILTEKPI
ncbi:MULTISPECIES: Hsp70 family protein [unclassified Nocardioides]|uniref:Hsp70 family protein n=1 Tax=unclassified Nocardioides TaxID=2615069 RepID=UPI0006F4B9F0|nr:MULTISPECIES: Hsp70 family protein [unclassified Nocardioides]KRA37881.1 hypothetical protein ASD81_04140 [Nocardioides sp. Root614]KRA91841.1 hypothetical protein ASD84_04405 [Nocardioides sp. Root682]